MNGQTATDQLILHTGEALAVYISGITEENVTFKYPDENVAYTTSINIVDEIVFASGRRSKGSRKVIVTSIDQWENVVITNNPEDIEGLIRKGDGYQESSGTTVFSKAEKMDAKTTKKIKQQAATLGAHIILLQNQSNDMGVRRVHRSIKSGAAYGYK
jgi:hypothetical protein